MEYVDHYLSPLGPITMASDGDSIIGLWFDGQRYDRLTIGSQCVEGASLSVFELTRNWLDQYFGGGVPVFVPPLRVVGSEFKRMVADVMLSIPYGCTTTYGQIAHDVAVRMGRDRMSSQAVGGAVGHNAISLIIPCHRVLGSDGSLTGYAGGLARKRALLIHEGVLLKQRLIKRESLI